MLIYLFYLIMQINKLKTFLLFVAPVSCIFYSKILIKHRLEISQHHILIVTEIGHQNKSFKSQLKSGPRDSVVRRARKQIKLATSIWEFLVTIPYPYPCHSPGPVVHLGIQWFRFSGGDLSWHFVFVLFVSLSNSHNYRLFSANETKIRWQCLLRFFYV